MRYPRVVAQFTRASDATAYTAGDHVAPAATVTPMVFNCGVPSGKIIGARMLIAPASGNLVITACDLDLLLFRPNAAPFADGAYPADNAACTLTEAAFKELLCVIPFVNTAWRNPLGALTAGAVGWQAALTANYIITGKNFNLEGMTPQNTIHGVLQAKAAWTPGAVVQTIFCELDIQPEL